MATSLLGSKCVMLRPPDNPRQRLSPWVHSTHAIISARWMECGRRGLRATQNTMVQWTVTRLCTADCNDQINGNGDLHSISDNQRPV